VSFSLTYDPALGSLLEVVPASGAGTSECLQ